MQMQHSGWAIDWCTSRSVGQAPAPFSDRMISQAVEKSDSQPDKYLLSRSPDTASTRLLASSRNSLLRHEVAQRVQGDPAAAGFQGLGFIIPRRGVPAAGDHCNTPLRFVRSPHRFKLGRSPRCRLTEFRAWRTESRDSSQRRLVHPEVTPPRLILDYILWL